MEKQFRIIVEKHPDGYVAYPLGLKGVVVGEGDSYEAALTDVTSAIQFHLETFGVDVLETEAPVLEAFIAETGVAVCWANSLWMRRKPKWSEHLKAWDFASSDKVIILHWFGKILMERAHR